jgi:SHS2 domain-containing protein
MFNKKSKYKLLEHVSDAFVEVYGGSLEESFENAAFAMFDIMTDINLVSPSRSLDIKTEGIDKESLLYNWLESLLIKFETEEILLSKFKINQITTKSSTNELDLKATVWGETFDPTKHLSKVAIKGVTYHLMEIREEKQKVTIRVLFDI